jgi:tripartite-type tricarboxylate transporter receptor subunit TctC
MKFDRRHFLHLAGAAALTAVPALACSPIRGRSRLLALAWPSRPVRLVVASAAGDTGEVAAHLLELWLSERLGQPFIAETRAGAPNVPAAGVRCVSADGYTFVVASAASAVNATLDDNLKCNFIDDITPVASLFSTPMVMVVSPSFPAGTVPSFMAYAKASPGGINMVSSGSGSPSHMAGELFKAMAGIGMAHVAHHGDAPAIADLLAGQAQVCFGALPAALAHIRAGNLRALAVTGATRSATLPDVPAMAEFLPGYEAAAWIGVNAPRNTPLEIVEKLNREVNSALADTHFKERLAGLGATPLPGSPSDYGRLIADETEKWARASGARVN